MAKGIDNVIKMWLAGKRASCSNVQTDGRVVYSYQEPIALEHSPSRFELSTFYVLESGAFTVTTSKHSNACANACPANRVKRVSEKELKDILATINL